jgi:hypothetical protein
VSDKPVRTFGPLYLTNTYTTNIYNNTSALIFDRITAIYLANTDSAAHTVRLYLGLTGANTGGTELAKNISIPANTTIPLYFNSPGLKMASTDFLVGGADANSVVTITATGYQAVV